MKAAGANLVEFLEARIDEDEEAARDAAGWDLSGSVRAAGLWCREGVNSVIDSSRRLVVYGDGTPPGDAQADHIVRHDPARVLRECAAKRAMIAALVPVGDDAGRTWAPGSLAALGALVTIYSDHPDYREEWAL